MPSLLDLAILGALKDQDLHGYELRKRLADPVGPLPRISFGSLYPALARLKARGAVLSKAPMPGNDTASTAGLIAQRTRTRDRVVYSITPAGQDLFSDLLNDPASTGDEDRGFNIRLAFARYLSTQERRRLLERRREQLIERASRVHGAIGRSTSADDYTRALGDHRLDTTERELLWVERLLVREATPHSAPTFPASR